MATGLTGRVIRRDTKEPLQGVTVEAINASTGVSGGSSTTDTKGFFEISGLASAVYFPKALVSGGDWDLQPNIAEIYTDQIHIAAEGVLAIDGSYSGAGSNSAINIAIAMTGTGDLDGVKAVTTHTSGNASFIRGLRGEGTHNSASTLAAAVGVEGTATASGAGSASTLRGGSFTAAANGTTTSAYGVEAFVTASGTATNVSGVRVNANPSGTHTTVRGVDIAAVSGGTNNRGLEIAGPSSGANNYAIYSTATAQSSFAGAIMHPGSVAKAIDSADATTTNTTATDITGLSFDVNSGEMWYFEAHMKVGSSSVAGCKYGVNIPSGGLRAWVAGTSTAAGTYVEEAVVTDDALTATAFNTAGLTTAAVGAFVHIRGFVNVTGSGGTVQLRHAKVTSGTSTVYIGSTLFARRIS